ncbi:hypothetical protein AC1031_016942 [Aphanomyces cochlioides]|nr:hypothetical protein AC1031_016942 [Aphanomyces cochlioides]
MERAVANPSCPDYYDMDVLNDLFKLDCGNLPNHYVVLTGTLHENVMWGFASKEERIAKTYVTPFSPGVGLGKPWDTSRSAFWLQWSHEPLLQALFQSYWAAEDELCSWLH